jgi:predicted transposase YbfD/YdcC
VSASVFDRFAPVPDFRIERKKVYPLPEILLLVVSGVVSGADGWEAIEQFGRAKLEWLRKFAPFCAGIPSHDCIAYVISGLSPKAFQACFASWTRAVSEATGGELIAVDGKTVRGSRDRRRGQSALHMVSAWGCRNRLVLGQEATAEKSNEITAIPKLLELLELNGCIVSIDAMGCQTKIAEQIIAQGADYVLGLKGNQAKLHEEVEDFFATALTGGFAGVAHDYVEETDKDLDHRGTRHAVGCAALERAAQHRPRPAGVLEWRPAHDRAAPVHQLHPRRRQALRPRGARPLGHREPAALAPGRRLQRRRQPHPQRPRARDHDRNPTPLHEPIRAGTLQAAALAETPRGRLERRLPR